MEIWMRSIAFQMAFYGWTALCAVLFFPLLFLPQKYTLKGAKLWARGVFWLSTHILGLTFTLKGWEKVPTLPLIFAVKHQSAWETVVFHYLCLDIAIVLKQDLMWIPFFGWYLKKVGSIPLSRARQKGSQSLRKLLKKASIAIDKGKQILIFPEGTRGKPGEKGTYHAGVASLYLNLNVPVVPVALNSGVYWPRRGFLRYPGVITLAFLDPIAPGLTRKEFMRKLEHDIESTTRTLLKGTPYDPKT